MKNIFICLFMLIISFMMGCSKSIDEVSISKDTTTNAVESDDTSSKVGESVLSTSFTHDTYTPLTEALSVQDTTTITETSKTTPIDTKKSVDTSTSNSNTKKDNNQTVTESSTSTDTVTSNVKDNSIELPQIPIE